MITVINGKKEGFLGKDKIYIGRKNESYHLNSSVLGNPFTIGKDGDRKEVVEKYRKWLWKEIQEKGEVYQELVKIGKQVKEGNEIKLVCWCKPLDCHGDVVKKCIEWMMKEKLV